MDYNLNIHRQQAVTREGLQRFKHVFPKSQKDWVVKPMYEKKIYDYLEDMLEEVLYERQESDSRAPLRKRKAAPQPEAIYLPTSPDQKSPDKLILSLGTEVGWDFHLIN